MSPSIIFFCSLPQIRKNLSCTRVNLQSNVKLTSQSKKNHFICVLTIMFQLMHDFSVHIKMYRWPIRPNVQQYSVKLLYGWQSRLVMSSRSLLILIRNTCNATDVWLWFSSLFLEIDRRECKSYYSVIKGLSSIPFIFSPLHTHIHALNNHL